MCGRFTRDYTWEQVHAYYRLIISAAIPNFQPNFNVCPTTQVDAIIPHFDKRELVRMRWGLIPSWWSKPLKDMRLATFNARAETVASKPMFRSAFKRNRCLMPASGYYEWDDTPDGKQPYYFTRANGQIMTIAALWDERTDKTTDETLMSCTMVIAEPNKVVAEVHDRMPVILEKKDFEQWERGNANDAAALMRRAAEDVLQKWPVSKRVNSSRTDGDDPTLIEAI
jgi:putative SOS response-associated peptidase YedK